ncbi:MAG: hydrolase [Alphaproteobacteria bacterium]
MLLRADCSSLLVIDVQQRLAPATHEPAVVVNNCAVLMRAARRLNVPVLLSEQYPKGLGATVPELASLTNGENILTKLHFSCAADPAYRRRFDALGRNQAVIAGMEAHVCVLQTAIDLHESGTHVFVVGDAITSRSPETKSVAISRMRDAGLTVVTTEMVVFEWLQRAGTPEFKELSGLIK